MEIFVLLFFIVLGVVGLKLLIFSIRENISAKAYAKQELKLLKKESELNNLRYHKIDIDKK